MPRRLILLGVALLLVGNAQARPATAPGTIASVAVNGSDLRTLSSGPGEDVWPTPSPDGKTVAFVHREGVVDTIRVVAADGTGERELGGGRLTTLPYSVETPPVWSPDGSELFVSAAVDDGNPRYERVHVFVVPLSDGTARDVQPGGTVAFSHDGRFIAAEAQQAPSVVPSVGSITVLHADLTRAVALGHGTAIAWSPTMDRIAFATRSGIVVAGVGGRRIWTLRGPFASTLAWLPNGKSIVYISRGKRPELAVATVGRQTTRHLADLPNPTAAAAPYALSVSGGDARWAPTGETLALVSGAALNIWPAGILTAVTSGVDPYAGLAWSPDGTRIYYAA